MWGGGDFQVGDAEHLLREGKGRWGPIRETAVEMEWGDQGTGQGGREAGSRGEGGRRTVGSTSARERVG